MGRKKSKETKKQGPRTGKKRWPSRMKHPSDTSPDVVHLVSYKISFDAIESDEKIPPEVDDQLEELHGLVHERPKQAIPRLEALKARHPNVPILYNYLVIAHSRVGHREQADAVARENYERNPEYLFARLNYAEICLQTGKADEIPRIFNRTYDLKMLYPHRDVFHVSEVVGFMGIMGMYFLEIGKKEQAERYHQILTEIDPESQGTQRLGTRLMLANMEQLVKRLRR